VGPTRPDSLAAWATSFSPSWLRCRPFSSPWLRLDLKPTIKIVPRGVSRGSGGETQNHETESQKAAAGEDRRGETPPESPPEGSTPLRRVHHQHLQQDHLHLSTVNSWQTWYMMQYTIPLIYCVSPSMFEKWFVHGNSEIVRWLVAYKFCYLLWLSLCTIYECTHMLGNACKVITGNVMEWGRLGRTCKPETESWSYFIGGYIGDLRT